MNYVEITFFGIIVGLVVGTAFLLKSIRLSRFSNIGLLIGIANTLSLAASRSGIESSYTPIVQKILLAGTAACLVSVLVNNLGVSDFDKMVEKQLAEEGEMSGENCTS